MTIRCIAKVTDAYQLDKKTKRTFRPAGAVAYDHRILRYKLDQREVSIWTVDGRQTIPFVGGDRQIELLVRQKGESDLGYIGGEFYLFAVCAADEPTPDDATGYLGVDLGIVNIATEPTCSGCGSVDKSNRKSQSHFECPGGYAGHAVTNAATNISIRGWASTARTRRTSRVQSQAPRL